jgi:POT family proton-dependent oligopeptide transporter
VVRTDPNDLNSPNIKPETTGSGPGGPTAPKRYPPQIKYIIGNEACERFSYYGMLSILTLYLKNVMGMDKGESTEVVHLFATAVYFLPLVGGWLADRWLGRYWTILSISLFYCLGHGALALFEGSLAGVYVGLGLIAIGAGGIKPCVSAFIGDQFTTHEESLLTKIYGWFYWAINLGAFFGYALIPWLRDRGGYSWAFGVPGIFMALATLIFWLGTKHYVRQPPAGRAGGGGFFGVAWYALRHVGERRRGQPFLDVALARYDREAVEGVKAVAGILMVFATMPVFWALFNQVNTTWVLQGEKMIPFTVLGYKVDGERIQSISALLVMIWVPILTIWVYPLAERLGLRPTVLRRMGTGMVLGAISFFICGWIQSRMDAGQAMNLAWQVWPYIVLEAGEVMVSATALEFAFSQAPARMKSIIMSFWLMTIAGGHFLVAAFTNLNRRFVHAQGASEFLFYAVLMLVVAGIFVFLATRYRERTGGTKG